MLTLFYRCLPVYYLILCALLGLSLAWLVTSESEIRLADSRPAASVSPSRTAAEQRDRAPADNRVILQRNIFNSSQPAEPVQRLAADSSATTATSRPVRTASNLKLIGTVVAADDSLAVINTGNQIEVIRLQHQIPGSGTLVEVQRDMVEIQATDGSRLILELDSAKGASAAAAVTQPDFGGRANTTIRNLGDNRWVIPATEAQMARDNISELIKQVRVDPYIVKGQTQGFILKRIQRGTLLANMGLKRGDILHAINGTTLDSPEKGLQIFQQLREAKTLNVDLQRAGQSMNFQYEIK